MNQRDKDKLVHAATHAYEYVVEGAGEFPIDMLRHDCAWPATERDSMVVRYARGSKQGNRTIMIRGLITPTVDRWASFGWTVTDAQ